ncbi:maltose alpha-D-glucosyltransferase [Phragmitibacter flavus]|uniref:Maltokinase n=1 Tax=Phragmitibacter flavus TaxID=2576071 RepID=A0A5R8KJU4_9BACT|nr:maltose alpha-D-glucosyltransferase [Phragmitibacter flavus]TLD72521.1 maltose alpha-D-glucosyltransferase [Phragmitibacter flavus]
MNSPQWFKDAVIYEVPIKSFQDSNGDGVGDIRGLIQRLDYLADLGITAIWILPFYPSPLRDDGYDISDYYSVNPSYGTIEDIRELLDESHRRGMKVITELIVNHTSDQCEWFQRARRAPVGSPERDFYVWTDNPKKYKEARIIFQDFETSNWTWDPVAKAYFWHRFYSHQPDLNFENPEVQAEVMRVFDFWLGFGVDGVRLDAIPYLFEREGTNCENLPETHAFLKKLRAHMDEKYPGRMLLAEANQWPEDSVDYFGDDNECHMAYHFPLMPRMFMSLQMEDRFPITDILDQTPAIPDGCQWALFLRNHDELTLEMVTDEERDYMYRVYAKEPNARLNLGIRRRLAPLLGNNRRKIELINSLLFSMPGTPIIYYGDEIGMGDNFYLGDRNGVRTPMQWNADRNAGFSKCNPQKLYLPTIIDPEYHYEAVNVENQQSNLSSLFWWMRRLVRVRTQSTAFARGDITFLQPDNAKVLAFVRRHEDETILVVANLSRFAQHVELNLMDFAGLVPEEMFGRHRWPAIDQNPMSVMMGPHGFYWFKLQPANTYQSGLLTWEPTLMRAGAKWTPALVREIETSILPLYLPTCRWFGGKGRRVRDIVVSQEIDVETPAVRVLVVEVMFLEGLAEKYLLPLAVLQGEEARVLSAAHPQSVIGKFAGDEVLCDAFYLAEFRVELLQHIAGSTSVGGNEARLVGEPARGLNKEQLEQALKQSRVVSLEQSNTSIIYGDLFFMKFFRKFESGVHPDQEMTSVLHDTGEFEHVPEYLGALKLMDAEGSGAATMLCRYTPHQGPGWTYVLDEVAGFCDRVLENRADPSGASLEEMIGPLFAMRVEQLAVITAEMHLALLKAGETRKDFAPEAFSMHYQRSLNQGMRTAAGKAFRQLAAQKDLMDESSRELVETLLSLKDKAYAKLAEVRSKPMVTDKIRIHGDYHLGQVLNTGNDFVVIDFEGEPSLSLGERRLKRSPLKDVAGMLRSFDYAAAEALRREDADDAAMLSPWLAQWVTWVQQKFVAAYLERAGKASFLPEDRDDLNCLLEVFMLEKAIYEVGYELSYRPEFAVIPLRAAVSMIKPKE